MPTISAILLFHNERSGREAAACADALREQTIADQIEVIAVCNTTDEAPLSFFGRNRSDVTIVRAHGNLGYGRGNNLGVRVATGEYILIINPDNRLEKDALETMVSHLRSNPDIGIIGPQLKFPDGTIRDSYRTFPDIPDIIIKRTPLKYIFRKRMQSYLQWDKNPDEVRDVDWLCGACLLMKRSLYKELGGFDERFFLFFEDCDLCRRVWEKGLRVVYFPHAKAHDNEQRLSAGGILSLFTKKTVHAHVASAIKYFTKWHGHTLPRTASR